MKYGGFNFVWLIYANYVTNSSNQNILYNNEL